MSLHIVVLTLLPQTLYFSHGFSPVFKDQTKVDVPEDIDVILVAPKGSGRTVRTLFREGRGINSSFRRLPRRDRQGRREGRCYGRSYRLRLPLQDHIPGKKSTPISTASVAA